MSLQYTNHSTTLSTNLTSLLVNQLHCDVVLACKDGLKISAHKIILAASCDYFRNILADTDIHQETIIVLRDIDRKEMKAILDFVYSGSVSVVKDRLKEFFSAANSLQVKELAMYSIEKSKHRVDIVEEITSDTLEPVEEVSETHAVKIEPQAFLDIMESEPMSPRTGVNFWLRTGVATPSPIESSLDNSGEVKLEPPEFPDVKREDACTLQIRTDIIIPEVQTPPPLPNHQHIPAGPDPPINFPETAQELVRNRIFGWNQKRVLQNLDSAEKILTKKPCVCTQCGARFSYRNQLTEHKRNAHD